VSNSGKSSNNLKDYKCVYPYGHRYVVKYKDGYEKRPCCISQPTKKYTQNIDDLLDNDVLQDVRNQMESGKMPDLCSTCTLAEKNGQTSWRQRAFTELYPINPSEGITSWDIRLDNICNLKCVMCNLDNSSKWNEDLDILKKYKNGSTADNRPKSDVNWLIDQTVNQAKHISLLGGEPFYSKNTLYFIKQLAEHKWNRENTHISLTTNGTKISNEWFDLLQQFRFINITFSIDGTENVNYLIRFPTSWEQFCKSVEQVKQNKTWTYSFNTTVSALNFPVLNQIKKYARPIWFKTWLEEPSFLSINSLKPEVVQNLSGIKSIDNYIQNNYSYSELGNDTMKQYLDDLDKRRGTDSKTVLPWCWI